METACRRGGRCTGCAAWTEVPRKNKPRRAGQLPRPPGPKVAAHLRHRLVPDAGADRLALPPPAQCLLHRLGLRWTPAAGRQLLRRSSTRLACRRSRHPLIVRPPRPLAGHPTPTCASGRCGVASRIRLRSFIPMTWRARVARKRLFGGGWQSGCPTCAHGRAPHLSRCRAALGGPALPAPRPPPTPGAASQRTPAAPALPLSAGPPPQAAAAAPS